MKILITGAEGYIGSHLCKLLRQKNISYFGYDIKSGLDVRDKTAFKAALLNEKPTHVVHLAAISNIPECEAEPEACHEVNVNGTRNILQALSGTNIKLAFASSAAVYGNSAEILNETSPLMPLNNYGRSKLDAENLIINSDVDYKILRIFNAAGADPELEVGEDREKETHIIPLAINAALKGTTLTIFGDGHNQRDFVHTMDISSAFIAGGRGIYNTASGASASVLQIVEMIENVSGRKVDRIFKDGRENEPRILLANITKAYKETGWKPQLSNLETIISTAYKWAKKLEEARK